MARSLVHPDFYPFVMPREVVKKLHFINLIIRDSQDCEGDADRTQFAG
jgi:hypothetical protein